MKKLRKLKKGLAILLTAAMVVGLVPNAGVMKASATETYDENGFAADGSYQPATDSDADGVYEIGNAGQLYWFAALVNGDTTVSGVTAANTSACAELMNDIIVNENVLKDDGTPADETSNFRNWTPIGFTFAGRYTGKFDGKGHTISGLYLINNSTGTTHVGLFGVTGGGAVITNLGVVDSYFAGKSYVGGVCARQSAGTISNCYNAGSVCGLASNSQAGGVCGDSAGLKHCYNRGKVWGSGYVGSLIGTNYSNGIENCYYLEGTAEKGVGSSPNVDVSSCVVGKNAEQFKSGEVTYLLNQSTSSGNLAWYQNIKGDAKDDFPVLDGSHKTVYQVTDEDNQITYINQALCQHEEYDNGICTSCGTFQEPTKSDEIYQIANYGNLLWFASEVNKGSTAINAELICDITANDNLIDANGNVAEAPEYIWTPIGNATNIYTGKFEGKGHTISGLYVKSTTDYVGLFGYVKNAEISNVGIVDSYFDGADYAGGICGYGRSVTITNCYNTGTVSCSGNYVGGICGYGLGFTDSPVTITNCYNTGAVSGSGDYVGGVCGSSGSDCVISNCYYLVGMPAGVNPIGQTGMFECSISQFASGEVAYRLQGEQEGTVWGQTLTGDNRQYSPVLGGAKVYATTGCVTYNNSGTSAKNHNKENGICKDCGAYDEATDSDDDSYYEIGNAGQLYWFAQQINNGNNNNINAVLTADITVNKGENTGDVANCNGTKADGWIDWVPIGDNATGYEYTGTFDGQNHTVSGLYFNDTNTNLVGLFGYSNGTIKNVGVVDSYFNGNYAVGGVCGRNYGVNATITNCFNTGTVGGKTDVGGVCGNNTYGTIENCYNTGQVSGTTSIGGVCGYNCGGSTIKNCYNTGQVSGTTSISGVCGYNDSYSTVKNCYYLTGTAENGVGNNQGTATNVESKATDKFKSGEVAYLLNEGKSEENVVWRQNLGETEADATPVLDSSHKIVYASKPCESEFANSEIAEKKEHSVTMSEDGTSHTCSVCQKTEQHSDVAIFTVNETNHSITAICPSCGDLGTITLSASDATYDGTEKAASTSGEIKGFTTPDIVYEKKAEDGSFATIDSIPKDAGTYRASITYNVGEGYTVSVEYTIAKADTTKTENCEMVLTFDEYSNTYTAAITEVEGAEYKFDNGGWSSKNMYTGIAHGTEVTGYIRIAAISDNYNPGTESSMTLTAGHGTLTHVEAKAADCVNDGNIEYWYCESCKKYFSDAQGTTETTKEAVTIAATGHTDSNDDGICEVCQNRIWYIISPTSMLLEKGESVSNISMDPKNGKVVVGEKVTVTTQDMLGYSFKGWYLASDIDAETKQLGDNANPQATSFTYTFKPEDNMSLVAVYEAAGNADVKISGSGFTVSVDDGVASAVQDGTYSEKLSIGSKVTITIVEENSNFINWTNENNKIVSTERTYTFTVTGQTTLTMSKKGTTGSTAMVEFVSAYNQVISGKIYSSTDTISFPDGPSKMGYTFKNWSLTQDEIQTKIKDGETHITVTPVYEQDTSRTYTVTVYVDGVQDDTQTATGILAGTTKTVNAPTVDGKVFLYWTDADGNILGYDASYFMQVNKDIVVKAVYGEAAVEAKPVIAMTNVFTTSTNGKNKISFTVTRDIPEGYTLVEHGVLYNKLGTIDNPSEETFVLGGTGVSKYTSTATKLSGIVTLNVNMTGVEDTKVVTRGYMIVKNSEGKDEIYYSDIAYTSYNERK